MASRPKRKQLNGKGTIAGSTSTSAGSCSPPGGIFSFSPPEVSARDGRKKRKDKMSSEKFTLTPYYDGHLWRKYGHKWIKDCPFPRLYFKCSYYEDKQCMATKLLQQHNNDIPPLFKVTYMYEHTCNAALVPAPDILAEAELTAASCDGLVLKFGSHDCGCWMQQEQKYHQRPMFWSSFQVLSFDSSNSQLQQPPAFPSDVRPPATAGSASSSSFPITKSLPASLSTNNEGYTPSTWNSFRYAIEEHLFDDVDFPGRMVSLGTEMDVHNLDSWACEGDVIL